jgi:hypothetical protein
VAELHQDKVTGLEFSEHLIPKALGYESPAAPAAAGTVIDLDSRLIKEAADRVAPTLQTFAGISDCRIADDK